MYFLKKDPIFNNIFAVNKPIENGMMSIPFVANNTDYSNFKKEIENETAQLQDADGNIMTAEEAKAYIATLP